MKRAYYNSTASGAKNHHISSHQCLVLLSDSVTRSLNDSVTRSPIEPDSEKNISTFYSSVGQNKRSCDPPSWRADINRKIQERGPKIPDDKIVRCRYFGHCLLVLVFLITVHSCAESEGAVEKRWLKLPGKSAS